MNAQRLVNGGQFTEVLERLTHQECNRNNTDAHSRTFLFELLCLLGEWDCAEKQLDWFDTHGHEPHADVIAYRNMVQAERHRRRVLSGAADPHFFMAPPPYVAMHLRALRMSREGWFEGAIATLKRAEDEWLRRPGSTSGYPFQSFRDADAFLGPILEVITDRYIWLPYEQIKRLEISAPRRLRDLLWIPVRVETVGGLTEEVFVPVQYVRSCEHSTDYAGLGRIGGFGVRENGVALRQFIVDGEKRAMLDIREVEFATHDKNHTHTQVMNK